MDAIGDVWIANETLSPVFKCIFSIDTKFKESTETYPLSKIVILFVSLELSMSLRNTFFSHLLWA